MDPLETFIEFSQWTGSVDEARERVNAAEGNVMIALERFYAGEPPKGPAAVYSNVQPVRHQTPHEGVHPLGAAKSLMDELEFEVAENLVEYPAGRVPANPVVYLITNPLIRFLFGKIAAVINFLGYKFTYTAPSPELAKRYYEKLLPVVGSPTLKNVSYNDALEKVKTKLKYLLVVITNETTNSPLLSDLQKSGVLSIPEVETWFSSGLALEGFRVAESLNMKQLPSIALIAPSPQNTHSSVIVMSRLLLTNSFGAEELMARVCKTIEDHEPKIIALRLERQQFDFDRQVREEQDMAYKESLEADQQREKEVKTKLEQEKQREFMLQKWRYAVFCRAKELESPGEKSARISVRLSDGKRINLSIDGNATVTDLYSLVYSHLNEAPDLELPDLELPDLDDDFDFEPQYGFGLVSPVLRKTLDITNATVSSVDALWPSGVLMVDME